MKQPLTYLALGDSYTVGEAVNLRESFPYQTVSLLREKGFALAAPEIVATTGWTTDELAAAIAGHRFLPHYDLVSLLIGVNNQYRGRALDNFREEFKELLAAAIRFAGDKKDRVFVLSIPDYGVTPFAKDRNPEKIGRELDAYNAAAKAICESAGVVFLDLSTGFRKAAQDPQLVATDGLHPSGKAYQEWAQALANAAQTAL
ncbi:Lysophospholipase L1 [Cnuella takakiae]|uniref:Lysophospholipase L1 n=1 Tax=Cnuella takakiae TaxID=1302690 RepID=A0A1M4V0J7_9BACT|nr:SGNH/GDSL hydrolase family protein [Cnuella takakiae]OLY92742.1 lysophospholipase [Cnuella takakiae]SHE62423.1 Lysophospholipase L1 [Cnuella takakiae]